METMICLRKLQGVFTGTGFARKRGRFPQEEDCGFLPGPIDIICNASKGQIVEIRPSRGHPPPVNGTILDARNLVATAGFIDCHTHALFAGNRSSEYFARWSGKTYQEIAAEGGGIHRSVKSFQESSDEALLENLTKHLLAMRRSGSTVVEVKSGYGGDIDGELRALQLIAQARAIAGLPELICTFLGLHALPKGDNEVAYVKRMIGVLQQIASERIADSIDAFVEAGFFSRQSCQEFLAAGVSLGLGVRLHAEQFTHSGAVEDAIALGALSVDHLEHISDKAIGDLAASKTVAVVLPATSLFLDIELPPAQRILQAGACVALATDFNPGSAPASDLQLSMLLAAAQLKMSSAEILCAVTYSAAAALGLEKGYGMLQEGGPAHINLWNANGFELSHPLSLVDRIVVTRNLPERVMIRSQLYPAVVD